MSERKAKPKMSFEQAMEIAEGMDLPDGAFWAMAHELAGLDYGDGFAQIAQSPPPPPAFKITKAIRAKIEKFGALHIHGAYHTTVRRDGKVIADWWPHKRKWRIAGVNATGDANAFVQALLKASPEKNDGATE